MNRYERLGVSSSKDDVHRAIANSDKGLFPQAFCKIVPDSLTGDPDYCLAMHADGAGTKSSLAYAYWRETGDMSVWEGIAQDALVMNLDDLLCVGVVGDVVLSSTIGRNRLLVPGEVVEAIIAGTESVVRRLQEQGVSIHLTGGETADVGDLVRTVIVDSTVVARLRRRDVIDASRIAAGDVIVGLASDGYADYETACNSGIGSNGLTAARHTLFDRSVAEKYPETYDPHIDPRLAYAGRRRLTDVEPSSGLPYGKWLLSPTRTYAPALRTMLDRFRPDVHGIIHCTGGGQTKALRFVRRLHVVKDHLFPTPPVFTAIGEEGEIPWREMYATFNMGHRMELYVPERIAADLVAIAECYGIEAAVVGHVEAAPNACLTISGEHGTFVYPS
ncbi:MAG: phosphoribosylformylglycinamidine cyclo-ligase [Prevotellaceae bacterium]|jgi:phosphoribosylformylglycinamidine cyclo-ligase|nr:phosphoribosylformylglycinamidine cyclo-ligase [Prevotellaceae bacterium]